MSGSPVIRCRKFSEGPWPGCGFHFHLEDVHEVFPFRRSGKVWNGERWVPRPSYPPNCPKCGGVLR